MLKKIDRRISYFLVFDTETANTLDNPLMYDLGFAIVDKRGKVYARFSLIIADVFFGMSNIMKSAYYAEKLPRYFEEIAKGERQVVSLFEARKILHDVCKEYNVKACIAHNARFDYRSTSTTQRYLTKSKYRFFLPFGIPLWDTMKMAHDTICKTKGYRSWCEENGFMTKHKTPRPQEKAETIYRYLIGDENFVESHTGLEDVMIEKEIFAHCMRQHKPMRKLAFSPR